jgi:hypothetical protein
LTTTTASKGNSVSFDEEGEEVDEVTEEMLIKIRTQEILANVWREYDTRMYTKSTTKAEFFDTNKATATELATKEIIAEREKKNEQLLGMSLTLCFYLPFVF